MTDNISPKHYQGFSNGAQVIDISENLTGNGSQIVQYVARATHQDESLRKGFDPDEWIEDLEKAKWFLEREISRLKGDHEVNEPEGVFVTNTYVLRMEDPFNPMPYPPAPRTWDSLKDVPHGVYHVFDTFGDRWESFCGQSWWKRKDANGEYGPPVSDGAPVYGPFKAEL